MGRTPTRRTFGSAPFAPTRCHAYGFDHLPALAAFDVVQGGCVGAFRAIMGSRRTCLCDASPEILPDAVCVDVLGRANLRSTSMWSAAVRPLHCWLRLGLFRLHGYTISDEASRASSIVTTILAKASLCSIRAPVSAALHVQDQPCFQVCIMQAVYDIVLALVDSSI